MTTKNIISQSGSPGYLAQKPDELPLVATKKNQIQSIPRRVLDPRRPKTDPTAQQQEEMLIKYDPVVPADPRLVISHRYEVRVELSLLFFFRCRPFAVLGCERPEDNHLSCSPRVDFPDFRIWTRLVWEQSNAIEHV